MNPKDTEYFRDRLNQQRDAIVRRAGGRLGAVPESSPDDMRDPADQAAEKLDTEIQDLVAESEENLLEKIDLALARLEGGNYQDCAGCGGLITVERLKAKPSASLCIDCQQAKEEGA